MRGSFIILAGLGLAACAAQPPATRSAQAQAKFQQLTAGKMAGAPISCLPTYRAGDMVTIDDSTVVFKQGRTVYVNHMNGGCSGLGSGFYALVTRSSGSGLCRGDIATVTDPSSGFMVGACSVGDFIPYKG